MKRFFTSIQFPSKPAYGRLRMLALLTGKTVGQCVDDLVCPALEKQTGKSVSELAAKDLGRFYEEPNEDTNS